MYRWLLLILTLGALSVPGRSAALDERAPDWDVMLKHFQLLADNYNAMIRDRRGSILKQFGEYDRILTFTENQSAKFDFLLDSYGDTGGFEALMRCRQISDLKQQFDDYLLQLERNCEILSDALERLKRLKADLEEDFNTASAAPFQAQLRQCLTAAERLENEFASLLKESQAYLKKFTETDRKVDALNTLAEQKRRQIVDGIFMKRGTSLWERVRNWGSWSGFRTGIREIFTLWRLNLTNWLELRIPTTGSFWARLLTVFLAIAIPVVPLGRRLIYPWFNRLAVIHEDEVSRGWFSAGLLLGSATAALWCAPGWLNGNSGNMLDSEKNADARRGVYSCPSKPAGYAWGGGIGISAEGKHPLTNYGKSIKITRMRNPSDLILLGDAAWQKGGLKLEPARSMKCPDNWSGETYILNAPHSGLANGALLDGHVAGRSRDQWKDSFQCDQGAKL